MSNVSSSKKQTKNLFVNVSLNDMLTKDDISQLRKYPQFHVDYDESNDQSDKSIGFEKNELIMRFISAAIDRLSNIKESALAKGLTWAKTQIGVGLDFKPDAYAFENLEMMKKNKPNMKMKLDWMEEYSTLGNQQNLYKITKGGKSKLRGSFISIPLYNESHNKNEMSNLTNENIFNNLNQDLLNFESQTFNIYLLEEKIGADNILPTVSSYIFSSLGLFSIINYRKFENFVYRIAQGYQRSNPYHNDLHAADMSQTLLLFLLYGHLQEILFLSEVDITSLFLAGIIHDYKHPGLTNNYLITTKNEIAIRYNDHSVLENFHVSETFMLITSEPKYNIFSDVTKDDYTLMRKRIIECVLATDMTLHNKEYQFLKMRVPTFGIIKGKNVHKIFENLDNVTKYNIQQEFLNVLIHAADVSNPTKPLEIYTKWAKKVVDEFFLQGDKERQRGMKISFLCDRHTVSLPQSQLGFIEGIVLPLYTVIVEYFPNLNYTITNINNNIEYFKKLKVEEEQKKEEKKF